MIVFENKGLVPLEAFTTFGVNAKPNTENPIGFFGTGLKYAVAVTLRLGGRFQLFVGHEEYEFYVKEADFRGKEFGMIRMRKRKRLPFIGRWQYDSLPFTTELGKNWDAWMAVRELESNTRDENGTSMILEETENPHEDFLEWHGHVDKNKTVMVIHCPEMEEAYDNLHKIFLPEKKLLAEVGPLEIYEGQSDYIFYRGLRVTDLQKPSLFTYNFTLTVTLTEDRTSKWPYSDMTRIMESIMTCNDQEILDAVMDAEEDLYYETSLPWDQPYMQPTTSYAASLAYRISSGMKVPKRMRSWHDTMNKEDEVNEYLEVLLKREHIRRCLDLVKMYRCTGEDNEIIEQLEKALDD